MGRSTPAWGALGACAPTTRARLETAALPLEHPAGAPIAIAGASAEGILLLSQGVVRIFHALSALADLTAEKLLSLSAKGWQVLHAPGELRSRLLTPG